MRNEKEVTQNWSLLQCLSVEVLKHKGAPFKYQGETWDTNKYFKLLGRLKKSCDRLNIVNSSINGLYEKYKQNIPSN